VPRYNDERSCGLRPFSVLRDLHSDKKSWLDVVNRRSCRITAAHAADRAWCCCS
jgi:hypothetical protein